MTSEAYGLRKNSPTVGCYFYAEDYLKFIKRLDYYTSMELKFIDVESSNHKEWIYEDGSENVPIGRLDDIEIIFCIMQIRKRPKLNGLEDVNV